MTPEGLSAAVRDQLGGSIWAEHSTTLSTLNILGAPSGPHIKAQL